MLKKLKKYLKSLKFCNSEIEQLPKLIENDEKIARSIFSPANFNKNGSINANTFKSKAGEDEVSVNRLSYASADICKKLSKKIEQPSNRRKYFGIAVLKANEIRNLDADVIYSPILTPLEKINIYHSDIIVGYIKQKVKSGEQGIPLPAEISYKIKQLTKNARLYKDPNPNSIEWTGSVLE